MEKSLAYQFPNHDKASLENMTEDSIHVVPLSLSCSLSESQVNTVWKA